jgi:hypothetical protein
MNMKKPLMVLVAVMLQVMAAFARDMVDDKGEYTPYGIAITLIASAQVSEMRCGKKGQIDLAIAKARNAGVPIDVNDKEDYASILFMGTEILGRLKKEGPAEWCKKAAGLEQILREP